MQVSNQVFNHPKNNLAGDILEKVILENDLSKLSPMQKVEYVKGICNTIGLNPVTKPIQLMKFQGREVPYFTKDASEQLRKLNRVSIVKVDTKLHDGGLYVVTVYASLPDGRQDCSTGTIVVAGLKGDALANAMMKAETKAKRRVTLSICGLGFIDELEVDSLPNVEKVDILREEKNFSVIENNSFELSKSLAEIKSCKTLEELQESFKEHSRILRKDKSMLDELILAKDIRKDEIISEDFISEDFVDVDSETGEVIQ